MNSTILAGTSIGNNCIIGANSLVKGNFPDNSVIVGNPAKIVCTLEEYYLKIKSKWVNDAKKVAVTIYKNSGHLPTIEEMSDGYSWLYLPRNIESVQKYNSFFKLTSDDYDSIVRDFLSSEPPYKSFDDFLNDCDFDSNS